MSYIYPTAVTAVSDSFQDHVDRGSVNPGTDYKAPAGSKVVSVAAGVVTDADGNPDGSGGRTVHVNHDDGSGADYLHLNAVSVSVGDRVTQGKTLGYSGGSGDGLNNYYGDHLHISFRRNHTTGYSNVGNIDFDALMRSQGTAPTGDGATPVRVIPKAKGTENVKFWNTVRVGNTPGKAYYGAYHIPDDEVLKVLVRYDTSTKNSFNATEEAWILKALAANGIKA